MNFKLKPKTDVDKEEKARHGASEETRELGADERMAREEKGGPTITSMEVIKVPVIPLDRVDEKKRGNNKRVKAGPKCKKFGAVKASRHSPPPLRTGEESTGTVASETDTDPGVSVSGAESLADLRCRPYEDEDSSSASAKSTVSGASKRSRGGSSIYAKRRMVVPTVDISSGEEDMQDAREDPDDDGSDIEDERKDKRGRPMSTGEGAYARQIKECKGRLKRLREEEKAMREMLDGGYDENEFSKSKVKENVRKLKEELPNLPTRDLVAEGFKKVQRIDFAAARSNNLKGVFKKELREAAQFLQVALDTIVNRAAPSQPEDGHAERLREENLQLRRELEDIKRKEQERAIMPPPPPPPPSTELSQKTSANEDGTELEDDPPLPPRRSRRRNYFPDEGDDKEEEEDLPPVVRPYLKAGGGYKIIVQRGERINDARPGLSGDDSHMEVDTNPEPATKVQEKKEEVVRKAVSRDPSDVISRRIDEMERKFDELSNTMMNFIQGFQSAYGPQLGDRARKNAPETVPPRGPIDRGHPVPETEKGRNKEKGKGKRQEGGGPARDYPPLPPPKKSQPVKNKAGISKAAAPKAAVEMSPLPGPSHRQGTFAQAVGRRETRATSKAVAAPPPPHKPQKKQAEKQARQGQNPPKKGTPPQPSRKAEGGGGEGKKKRAPKRRAPRTSAVTLTCPKGKYADIMGEIRDRVKLAEVGLKSIKTRTAMTGAMIIEVAGPEHGAKADALLGLMRDALKGKEGVRVDRPTKSADIRVRGLESSITEEEVVAAVAEKAGCRTFEVQSGTIRSAARGQGSLWLRLPLVAAKKAVEGGGLVIGWSQVKVDLLEARPLRCHKCLERGHVREMCPGPDRSQRCYRCGEPGHISRDCRAPPKCPICSDTGRPADHALGASKCTQRKIKGGGNKGAGRSTGANAPAPQQKDVEMAPLPQGAPRGGRDLTTPSMTALPGEEGGAMELGPLTEGGATGL